MKKLEITQIPINRRKNKIDIHPMAYYSAIKRTLTHPPSQMRLEIYVKQTKLDTRKEDTVQRPNKIPTLLEFRVFACKRKQTFFSINLGSLLAFKWRAAGPTLANRLWRPTWGCALAILGSQHFPLSERGHDGQDGCKELPAQGPLAPRRGFGGYHLFQGSRAVSSARHRLQTHTFPWWNGNMRLDKLTSSTPK